MDLLTRDVTRWAESNRPQNGRPFRVTRRVRIVNRPDPTKEGLSHPIRTKPSQGTMCRPP